jgi:GT2 family glycosyltransferase
MTASIVILTRNRDETLPRTLRCCLQQDHEPLDIVLVDDSTSHSQEVLTLLHEAGTRITLVKGPGYLTGARNAGVRAARGEFIVFVDDDTEFDAGFVAAHLSYYTEDAIAGVAGHFQEPHYNEIIGATWFRPEGDTKYATGCNMSFRRRVLWEIGGFDERYRGTGLCDEMDVCFRVRRAGYRIVGGSRAFLVHYRTPSGGSRAEEQGQTPDWYSSFFRNAFAFCLVRRGPLGLLSFWLSERANLWRYARDRGLTMDSVRGAFRSMRLGWRDYRGGARCGLRDPR